MSCQAADQVMVPLLDQPNCCDFPNTFSRSFRIVFGYIWDEDDKNNAFFFLNRLNRLMEERKGGGTLRKEEIISIRPSSGLSLIKSRKYNKHHVIPTSRDQRPHEEKKDQIVRLPVDFHQAWHAIFMNLYGKETIVCLERIFFIMESRKKIDYYELNGEMSSLRRSEAYGRV